ncbi:MAG: lactate utilization protein [Bacillota bacterium]
MNENIRDAYRDLLAQKLIAEFEKRNMTGCYCKTKEEALDKILSMLKKDDVVSNGGSETLWEIGFQDAVKSGGYRYLNPHDAQGGAQKNKIAHEALSADYYFMSANAISETGELVHIDGIGNRTAALMFGPKHVVIVAGLNKVSPNLEAALTRAKTYASRICLTLFKKDYASYEELCAAADMGASHIVVTRRCAIKDRITILLVGEELGF